MDQLSSWGEVTSENEQQVIAANLTLHPLRIELLEVLTEILNSNNIEYWIDQGSLLGAYRNGKLINRDCDVDMAMCNDDHFSEIPRILNETLPEKYNWNKKKREGTKAYNVYFQDGGLCEGSFNGKEYSWQNVSCDIAFYKKENGCYIQEYKLFSVDTFLIPENTLFPLSSIKLHDKSYPCPNKTEEYLKIQYGYIGENAVYDPETDRYVEKD